jgi:hypothetical protein
VNRITIIQQSRDIKCLQTQLKHDQLLIPYDVSACSIITMLPEEMVNTLNQTKPNLSKDTK